MRTRDSFHWQNVAKNGGGSESENVNPSGIARIIPTNQTSRLPLIFAIGLIVFASIIAPLAYHYMGRINDNCDPFTYAEEAKEMMAGRRLYSEIYFDKGPLVMVGFAIPQFFSPRDFQAIGAFLGFVLIGQAIIFAWAFRFDPTAMVGAALFIIVFPLTSPEFVWLSSEHLSNFFVAGNLALAYNIARQRTFTFWNCFLVGLISCLALNVRQTALLSGFVPAVLWIIYARSHKKLIRAFLTGVFGGLVGFAFILALVSRIGDFQQYAYALFLRAASYGGAGMWSESWKLFSENSTGTLAMFAGIFMGLALFSRHRTLVITSVIAAILTCALPRRDFIHYLVGLFPYVALMIGVGLERHTRNGPIFGWACAAFLVYVCLPLTQTVFDEARRAPKAIEMADVAHAVDRDNPDAKSLLVWGKLGSEPIVFASRIPPANQYWILWMLESNSAGFLPISVDQIFTQYLSNPPAVMAMDHDFLKHAQTGVPVRNINRAFDLGKTLLLKYKYVVTETVNGFDIAVLRTGPGGIPGATTQPSQDQPQ
jgi:hypothetical protein